MKKSTKLTKLGLAEMLKGGVIMDVVDADQARIAEDAGACAVMALERVPAQIRAEAVTRNAWGRQLDSFEAESDGPAPLPLVFIRAPRIDRVGPEVDVLARYRGEPTLVRRGTITAATFHPELSGDTRVHAGIFGGHFS